MALPISPITVRTSWKSTLIWPCTLMISAMPPTAFFRTLSAALKAVVHQHVLAQHFHQLLVEDDDQRVDRLFKFFEAVLGQAHALAFVVEGLGHHRHGEDAEFARHLGDDRRGAGAGAAAHAGRDEGHVGAAQRVGDLLARRLGVLAADVRLAAGAETRAELQLDAGAHVLQRLGVGVGADELNALHALADHVLDGIATRAADTDDLDDGRGFRFNKFKHARLLVVAAAN